MNKNIFGGCLTIIIVAGMTFIFMPSITLAFGYLGGLGLKWIFGDIIETGINSVLNITTFKQSYIPITAALLALVGSYFKSTTTNKNNAE